MSREKAIKILKENVRNSISQPHKLFCGKILKLLESEPEQPPEGKFTEKFRASCEVAIESDNIDEQQIQNVLNNTGILGIKVRLMEGYLCAREGLEACDRIDRLEAENKKLRHEIDRMNSTEFVSFAKSKIKQIEQLRAELKAKEKLLEQVLHRAYEEGWTEKPRLKETYHKIEQGLKGASDEKIQHSEKSKRVGE